jgi:hypothetical protein
VSEKAKEKVEEVVDEKVPRRWLIPSRLTTEVYEKAH